MKRVSLFVLSLILVIGVPAYAAAEALTFSAESGSPSDTLTVSINVDNLETIVGYNIDFTYDSTVLTATGATIGSDATGTFIANVGPAGQVSLGLINFEGNASTSAGELATVDFTILSNAHKNSALTFTRTDLKDENGANISGTTSTNGTVTVTGVTTTVTLDYSASDTSSVPAGSLTITATFSQSQSEAPTISIDQQGSVDISDADMTATADGIIWTYAYTVQDDDGSNYIDGEATVTIKNSSGTSLSISSGSTFTIDTSTTVAINSVTTPTTSSSQVITGTKESGATVAVAVTSPVAAGSVTYPTSTTWSCTISNLQEGANSITVTATDTAGNTDQDTTSITYVDTAPQVSSATYVDTTHVDIVFSEAVIGGTTASRYTISGVSISSVTDQGSNTYRLITSTISAGQIYTVVVSTAMTDLAGNAMDSNHNSTEFSTLLKGDVNGSSAITPADASATFQLYLTKEWAEMTALEKYSADFNNSGSVTPADASAIFQEYLGQ